MTQSLKKFIEAEILPRYDAFDKAHSRDHIIAVIEQSLNFVRYYDVNEDMVYAAAAYHDLGIEFGRELHHIHSARIVREDSRLLQWFNPQQIETIACAVEDHRASSKSEPRGIYGRILAESDRVIIPEQVVLRTIQFGQSHYPACDTEQQWQRTLHHLKEKYGHYGYLRLWIPESPNHVRLQQLRNLIDDEVALRKLFDQIVNGSEIHID